MFATLALFLLTALAELSGSYLLYLCLRQGKSALLSLPAAILLFVFGYLLTLHPGAAARTYAAYGGVYIFAAIFWLWWVEAQKPSVWDILGVTISLIGALIVIFNRPD